MEPFDLHVLGCGSALPTGRHYPSCQVLDVRNKLFVVDCGEGAQLQLRRTKLGFSRINAIFISHFHGDHCFGLPGLISTLALLGRTVELPVFLPLGADKAFAAMMHLFCQGLPYQVSFRPFDASKNEIIYEDKVMTVATIPLRHRIPCAGFLFKEKLGLRHIDRPACDFYHVPEFMMGRIKHGEDFVADDGEIIANERLTTAPTPVRSYAYCSDTAPSKQVIELVRGVDLLYHEATFSEENRKRAKETYHTTARDAADIALQAGVKQLMVGHFSARYSDEKDILKEAKAVFPNTILACEGLSVKI